MAQALFDIPVTATADQIVLLQAIKAGQDENDAEIGLALNTLNKGVAQLVEKNGRIITKLQGDLQKKLNQHLVDNDNTIDQLSTSLLSWTQNELSDMHLLLTQLAASAGVTSPGDPLEAALTERLAAAPDMAYSATLLMAIREAMPHLGELVKVLREIRDRISGSPVRFPGEATSSDVAEIEVDFAAADKSETSPTVKMKQSPA